MTLIAALPFVAHRLRSGGEERCAWDGLEIEPIYRVRIVEGPGITYTFCCLQCAELWLERRAVTPDGIRVTDEAGGSEIDATAANYVRSTIPTNAITGNRVHVFRSSQDAQKHAEAANGRRLLGAERPFSNMTDSDSASP